jgi:hypothetical protein
MSEKIIDELQHRVQSLHQVGFGAWLTRHLVTNAPQEYVVLLRMAERDPDFVQQLHRVNECLLSPAGMALFASEPPGDKHGH